ncbi:MAG: sulfotransferase domain-containing protein [Deltaproteobacteria bacterium]|nr:MAG: sulfotransferase domain-containing protein [Deltaproteobacteria bacterium]
MNGIAQLNWSLRVAWNARRTLGPKVNCYYLGHHKCATNWIRRFLWHVCELTRFNYEVHGGDQSSNISLPDRRYTFYLYVNSNPQHLDSVPEECPGFHLFRDPRDVLISDYYSRRYSHRVEHGWAQDLRECLNTSSLEDGLLHMLDHTAYYKQIEGWRFGGRPNILEVKYEDLLNDERRVFGKILQHLQIGLPENHLRKIIARCSFKVLSGGRERGQEDPTHHFRKGVAGNWKEYFSRFDSVQRAFYSRYGHLLPALGYE